MDSSPMIQKLSHLIKMIDMLTEKVVQYRSSCEHVAASINLLKAPLIELQQSQKPLSADEVSTFNELEFTCLKSKELLESCTGRSSKLILVLSKQQEFKDLQCRLKSLRLETLSMSEHYQDLVQEYGSVLESLDFCADFDDCLEEEVRFALEEVKRGTKLSHGRLVALAGKLGFNSNQEILKEACLLEMEKTLAHRNKNEEELINLLIVLVTQMSDDLVEQKHLQAQEEGISIPADLRCPLSLELMSDPVIVASGQTYERAYIQQWLDEGNTTCPKSRQTLSQLNLTSNFTVKALIASWCEQNGVPFPEPVKLQVPASRTFPVHMSHVVQRSTEDAVSLSNSHHPIAPSRRTAVKSVRTIPNRREESEARRAEVGSLDENGDVPHSHLRIAALEQPDRDPLVSLRRENSSEVAPYRGQNALISSHVSSVDDALETAGIERNPSLSNKFSPNSSDESGDLNGLPLSVTTISSDTQDCQSGPGYGGMISRRQLTENEGLELCQAVQSGDVSEENRDGVQSRVRDLVRDLQSTSCDLQRSAATELRLLAKHSVENRIIIADSGAIPPLVLLLYSTDPQVQANAVTALLNLSINNNNKSEIAAANAVGPLVHVLNVGTSEARENAAATLFSLSVMDENKITIGESGAIEPLVDLLTHGTPRGKKDAATALFNLSIHHGNKVRIVRAKAVGPLIGLMSDPAAGMVDKAVAVIANLATIQEGRDSIAQEEGIPALVEVVEMGSPRGKENAAAALLHLCSNSSRIKIRVVQEGAIPHLAALTKMGTARAKEKASSLLRLFREQRHGRGESHPGRRR